MNILVLSGQWTAEPKGGGVQSSVCTLVDALSKQHAVTVFVPRWQQKTLLRESGKGFRVYRRRIGYPQGRGLLALKTTLSWLVGLPGTLRDIRRVCRDEGIEVIHLYQLQRSQATFALARLLGGPPYVTTFHGRDVRDYRKRPWIERLVIRQVARLASGFTAVSGDLAALAEREIPGARNVRVIRNGVALPEIGAPSADDDFPPGLPGRYLLAVGRLYPLDDSSVDGGPLKGQDLLIRAWAKLQATQPDLHLLLAGADDERKGYEALAEDCGVAGQIHILGSLPRRQLFSLMKRALAVVTASRSEGGGPTMTILETGSLARPLIASSIPAHSESLQDGVDSLLVPPEDPEAIAAAVERLAGDPALAARLGEALEHKVHSFGTSAQTAEAYVAEAYRPALAPPTA